MYLFHSNTRGLSLFVAVTLLLVVALSHCETATREGEPPYAALHELDDDTFDAALFVGRWIVLFHDPSIPRCQEALRVMSTMAFSNGIACAHVNCIENLDLCRDYSLRTNYPIFMGVDPYMTVPRFYLKPDPDEPLTNTTLIALWQQHISGDIEELTTATFDKVLNTTWVVMPYIPHSLSTQENDGVLRLIAGQYHGKVRIGKIDCWEHSETCQKYEMTTLPRTLVFHEGGIFNLQGSHTKDSIKNFVFKAMNGKWTDYRDELESFREQWQAGQEARAQHAELESSVGPKLNEPSQRHAEQLEADASDDAGEGASSKSSGGRKRRRRVKKVSKAQDADGALGASEDLA